MASSPSSVVLSDLHLGLEPRTRDCAALCDVIAAYPGTELIFVGDSFEFSSIEEPDPERAWRRLCEANSAVVTALRAHIEAGGRVTFIAGNHDAALPVIALAVQHTLAPNRPDAVHVAPWFVRRGGVHLEHGHVWDRDNAPLHPLADWSLATEPLGIALMRRFVTRQGAAVFAHAHDTTPVAGLWRAYRSFGHRFPAMALGYFSTAAALCLEASLPRKLQTQQASRVGQGRLGSVASAAGVCPRALERVLRDAPAPTHGSARDTFMRLYFDRVFASVGLTFGLGAVAVAGAAPLTLGVLGASSAYLAAATLRPRPRYEGPVEALRAASAVVADTLAASVVVFGHCHVPEQSERYVNLGSFAYCRQGGRPYATLDGDGRATLRRHAEVDGRD